MPHLPSRSFPRHHRSDRTHLQVGGHPSSAAAVSAAQNPVDTALNRTLPLRSVAVTVLALAAGYLFIRLCRPSDSTAILGRHFVETVSPTAAWLHLLAARLPFLCLLAVAGLTRFSGSLCTAILAFRGVCDGGAIALLLALLRGTVDFQHGTLRPWQMLLAFSLWMLCDTLLRIAVAVSARRLAAFCATVGDAPPPETAEARTSTRAAVRYRLWRHATVSAAAVAFSMVACFVYILVIL